MRRLGGRPRPVKANAVLGFGRAHRRPRQWRIRIFEVRSREQSHAAPAGGTTNTCMLLPYCTASVTTPQSTDQGNSAGNARI